jgi:hypothetical protein
LHRSQESQFLFLTLGDGLLLAGQPFRHAVFVPRARGSGTSEDDGSLPGRAGGPRASQRQPQRLERAAVSALARSSANYPRHAALASRPDSADETEAGDGPRPRLGEVGTTVWRVRPLSSCSFPLTSRHRSIMTLGRERLGAGRESDCRGERMRQPGGPPVYLRRPRAGNPLG